MKKFNIPMTYLPVTMKQFEDLTNEILTAVNEVTDPLFLDSDYLAQILMSAIHALDHKVGRVEKNALFEACINRISCHVTFHAVEEIQKKLGKQADPESDDGLAEITPTQTEESYEETSLQTEESA